MTKRHFEFWRHASPGIFALAAILLSANALCGADVDRLEQKLAALRAAGEPMSLADLVRDPIAAEDNAATYLGRAKSDLQAIRKQVDAAYDAISSSAQAASDRGQPSEGMLRSMRAALAAYPTVIPLLEKASQCTGYDPQWNFNADTHTFLNTLLPQIQVRDVARVLNYRARVLLADGRPQDALQSCLISLRLARDFDTDPMIVSQLVALAVRGPAIRTANLALRGAALPDSAYEALETELARHDLVEQYRQTMRSERAFGLQTFRERVLQLGAPATLPWFKNDQCDYLDLMGLLISSAAIPYSDPKTQESIERVLKTAGPLTRLLIPAVKAQRESVARVQAEIRALRVLNALERRERSGNGAETALAKLGLPIEALTDPFNGQPLQVKKLANGWLVYSVGKDAKDNGGHVLEAGEGADVGLGPPGPPAEDDSESM